MNQAWPTKRLADVCQILGGATPSKKNPKFYGGDIPWATVGDMNVEIITTTEEYITKAAVADCSTNVIPSGSIVMATRVGLGKVCVLGQDTAINQDLKGLTPKNAKELTTRWLFWWLKSKASDIQKAGTGATVQGVKMTFVQELEIPLPPLAEQKRIVALLDEAFAGIDEAKAKVEVSLASAQKLTENYFQSVIDRQGRNWTPKQLSELCDIKHGYAFEGEFFSNKGNYVLLTPGNFYERGGYRDRGEKQKYYTGEIPREYVLNKGDLLVAMTEQAAGLLGSPIMVPESDKFLHNQRLGLVTKKPEAPWTNKFFFHIFNSPFVRKSIHDSASGVKVRHTSPRKIGDVVVTVPSSTSEQDEIVGIMESLDEYTKSLTSLYQQKQSALTQLKQSLLTQAFAGELTA